LEVEHLGPRVAPEPQQKFRRQQRDMMASGTIDLDQIAMPEILDPRGKGAAFQSMFLECSKSAKGLRQRRSRSDTTAQARRGARTSFGIRPRTVVGLFEAG
jgi:hypothetical protein